MHGPELALVQIVCAALLLGAGTRVLARSTRFPFTLALLLIGLAAGLLIRAWAPGEHGALGLLASGHALSSYLIIFVFLPTLVFESAFSLDTFAFRRELGTISLLAIPAMVASTVLCASLMLGITAFGWQWGWPAALVFGALISATDPVAVVALMREVGAPKRLGVLVEGESLLNDGTAIVLFGVLLSLLSSAASQSLDAGAVALRFVVVVSGGIGVGLVLSMLICAWISRTFNDPLVEISLTILLAYLAMALAEGALHVSGVMAVVTAGLWMAGPGRTKVSPEVAHFLHKFWSLLVYMANTLIFLLVGVVIALQIHDATLVDLLVIPLAYAGLVAVRFVVVFAFRPLFGLVGEPVSAREALVLSWGGLRGAVSLALALAVNQHPSVPAPIRQQILLLTAGIVLLTIVVNGGTTGALIRWLGFDRLPAPERLAVETAVHRALRGVRDRVRDLRGARSLPTVRWDPVLRDLDERLDGSARRLDELQQEVAAQREDASAGYWHQALEMEREQYWAAFADGTLGARAVQILDHEIDLHLARLERGDCEPPRQRIPRLAGPAELLAGLRRRMGLSAGEVEFARMALLYDLYQAERSAARQTLRGLRQLTEIDAQTRALLERTYERFGQSAKQALEEMRVTLPELTTAIEHRLTRRIELNYEREAYRSMAERGVLPAVAARQLHDDVERRMTTLQHGKRSAPLPGFVELCRETHLLGALDAPALDAIAARSSEQLLAPGEQLFAQGEPGDSLYIIGRGALYVLRAEEGSEDPHLLDVCGGGDIVGEMSLLTGEPRTASLRAVTATTLFRIDRTDLDALMTEHPTLEDQIWRSYGAHVFDNLLRAQPRYDAMDHDARAAWLYAGEYTVLEQGQAIGEGDGLVLLIHGALRRNGWQVEAPALVGREGDPAHAVQRSRVVLLPQTGVSGRESTVEAGSV